MFWQKYYQLCISKGITPNDCAKLLGFSSGSQTNWKNGAVPSAKNLKKIADYFNVSTDYLINGDETSEEKEDVMADVRFAFTKLSGDPTEITEEDLEDVKKYVIYIKEKRKKERNGNKS